MSLDLRVKYIFLLNPLNLLLGLFLGEPALLITFMLGKTHLALKLTRSCLLLAEGSAQVLNLLHVEELSGAELLAAGLLRGSHLTEVFLERGNASLRQGNFVGESDHLLLSLLQFILEGGIRVSVLLVFTVFLEGL